MRMPASAVPTVHGTATATGAARGSRTVATNARNGMGAVLAPALYGIEKMGDLVKASSLCGACQEICPVRIPIPHMLLQLRDEGYRKGVLKDPVPWKLYSFGATHESAWRMGLKLLPIAESFPHPLKKSWSKDRTLPKKQGRSFREWWSKR